MHENAVEVPTLDRGPAARVAAGLVSIGNRQRFGPSSGCPADFDVGGAQVLDGDLLAGLNRLARP